MDNHDVFDELTWKERDGLRLRALRRRYSLTQVELAERAGVSRGIVGQLELGRHFIPIKMASLSAIARALHHSPTDIFPDTMWHYHEAIVRYLNHENQPDDALDLEELVKLAENAKQCA